MKEEVNKLLFSGFQDITTEAWEEKIKSDLKGADYQRRLVWKTDEGINVNPYYREEDLSPLDYLENVGLLKTPNQAPNGWTICQDIFPERDMQAANALIKAALKGGAQAIRIHLKECPPTDKTTLEALLKGVPLGETRLLFQGCMCSDALYNMLHDLAIAQGVNPDLLEGSMGADPMGTMARTGIPIASMENIGKLVKKVSKNSPNLKSIEVNGALIQNSGSTLVEELAFGLAMASEYMNILTAQGIDPNLAQDSLELNLASGSNYFMEIAKLRAARILWTKISESYGIEAPNRKIQIHSTTSEWNMTLYDPHVNMLRGTTEAMSSIIGGADLLSVLPFDYPYGKSSEFSNRIARNVQIILREEAYFDRVMDPAAGSYYIESLTDSIGEKAWELFCETEEKGGFRKARETGWVQEQVMESRDKKIKKAASGKGKILGTNAFPDFNEVISDRLQQKAEEEQNEAQLLPIQPFRLSTLFEEARLETEMSGKRPRVLLYKYGNPAWVTARAAFSGNFFACGGYEIVDQPAFATIEEGIQEAKKSNVDVVVLCSSDDAYAELAPAVYNELKEHSVIVVAGYPSETIELLQKAGIEHFIHMKSNLLETLKEFNKIIL